MRDIYSRARRVVIFLGDNGNRPTLDGELMHRTSEQCWYGGNAIQVSWSSSRDGAAVRALFDIPYWGRIWVIQEVLLAKEAVVVLGGSSVPLSRFWQASMDDGRVNHWLPPWTQLTGPAFDGDGDAFSELLIKTSSCQALDARDRVFALLGLVQGAHLEGLVADYSKTVDEIHTGIAAYFILRHGQSNIL